MAVEIIPSEGMQLRQRQSRGSFTFPGHWALNSRPALPSPVCLPYWPHSLTLWVSLSLYVSFVGIVTTSHHHQPQPAHSIQDTISDGNLSPGEGEEERTNLVKLRHHNNYISDIHYFFFIFQPRTAALGK